MLQRVRQHPPSHPIASVPRPDSKVSILTRRELARVHQWPRSFGGQRKDHRYLELVEDAILPRFEHRYLAIDDGPGNVQAIQPCFLVDQDLLEGMPAVFRRLASMVRRWWPRFLRLRTLMLGCAAGEGHLDDDIVARHRIVEALPAALDRLARQMGAQLIVLKEFPAEYRPALAPLVRAGFTRIPSLPMTQLGIAFADFDDYARQALGSSTRRKMRRDARAAARAGSLDVAVVRDISAFVDEVYPLYLNVYERSDLRFEKLTREFFCQIGQRMPDKTRFFVWRHQGRIVACGLCLVHADSIFCEYLGLDYAVASDLRLYHNAFRDIVSWGIANGYKRVCSTSSHYDPKLHWGCTLMPLDLYVRHRSRIVNRLLKPLLPLLSPVRYDRVLPRFANYRELWD